MPPPKRKSSNLIVEQRLVNVYRRNLLKRSIYYNNASVFILFFIVIVSTAGISTFIFAGRIDSFADNSAIYKAAVVEKSFIEKEYKSRKRSVLEIAKNADITSYHGHSELFYAQIELSPLEQHYKMLNAKLGKFPAIRISYIKTHDKADTVKEIDAEILVLERKYCIIRNFFYHMTKSYLRRIKFVEKKAGNNYIEYSYPAIDIDTCVEIDNKDFDDTIAEIKNKDGIEKKFIESSFPEFSRISNLLYEAQFQLTRYKNRREIMQNENNNYKAAPEGNDQFILTIVNTNIIRFGGLAMIIFLAGVLIPVYRYNTRLASFYMGRHDALVLWSASGSGSLETLCDILTPAHAFEKEPAEGTSTMSSVIQRGFEAMRNKDS